MLKKLLILGILLYLIWVFVFSKDGYLAIIYKRAVNNQLKQEICNLQKQNKLLSSKIHKLKIKDKDIIAKEARNLGMLKKDEKILRFFNK